MMIPKIIELNTIRSTGWSSPRGRNKIIEIIAANIGFQVFFIRVTDFKNGDKVYGQAIILKCKYEVHKITQF